MGTVTVLYFASAGDAVGKRKELVGLEGRTTAGEILDWVVRKHPGLRPMKGSVRLSVNQEVVELSAPVGDGDEVGVLPPVAGG